MTESEAKKRWCPQVRTINTSAENPVAINRDYDGEVFDSMKCIGSGCMMWVNEKKDPNMIIVPDVPMGHCGLAR